MKLSKFFESAKTRDIVINSDIDGFLSGMILQKYYGCRVVGFSNSKESIWLSPDIESLYDPVYVDIYVNNPETYSIDQHIIAFDDEHAKQILSYGTKLNPNINLEKRTFLANYNRKYPFGTVHYLITLMKEDSVEAKFCNLVEKRNVLGVSGEKYSVYPIELLLRADDALYSSLGPYKRNTDYWWNILKNADSSTTNILIEFINCRCKRENNYLYKERMRKLFCEGFHSDGSDGAFDNITEIDNESVSERIKYYNKSISKLMGIELQIPNKVNLFRGELYRKHYCDDRTLLDNSFSYAFIYGPSSNNTNLSYTINVKRHYEKSLKR